MFAVSGLGSLDAAGYKLDRRWTNGWRRPCVCVCVDPPLSSVCVRWRRGGSQHFSKTTNNSLRLTLPAPPRCDVTQECSIPPAERRGDGGGKNWTILLLTVKMLKLNALISFLHELLTFYCWYFNIFDSYLPFKRLPFDTVPCYVEFGFSSVKNINITISWWSRLQLTMSSWSINQSISHMII